MPEIVKSASPRFSLDNADWTLLGWTGGNAIVAFLAGLAVEVLPRLASQDYGAFSPLVAALVFMGLDFAKRARFNWPMPSADWSGWIRNSLIALAGMTAAYLPMLQSIDFGSWNPAIALAIPMLLDLLRRWLANNSPAEPTPQPAPDFNVLPLALVAVLLCGTASAQPAYTDAPLVASPAAEPAPAQDLRPWSLWLVLRIQVGMPDCPPSPLPNPPQPIPPQPVPPRPEPVPPVPTPEPIVPPTPKPEPLPEGKFGLAKLALQWASAVNSPDRAAEAAALAEALEGVASKIAAGALKSDSAIMSEVIARTNEALASHYDAWQATFGKSITAKLKELYWASKLKTDADWIALLKETAAGLRAVR